MESVVVLILSIFSIIFALGAWVSRDNFYSALLMSATMLTVGAIYALHGIYSTFLLIAFIFIGAIGIVTVAVAATYRFLDPRSGINEGYLVVAEIIGAFLALTVGLHTFFGGSYSDKFGQVLENYLSLVAFLIVLTALLMLSALSMLRRESA